MDLRILETGFMDGFLGDFSAPKFISKTVDLEMNYLAEPNKDGKSSQIALQSKNVPVTPIMSDIAGPPPKAVVFRVLMPPL